MKLSSIAQSAVIVPVQLTIDPSHQLLWMEVQADAETSTWQHTAPTWDIHVTERFETSIPARYGSRNKP